MLVGIWSTAQLYIKQALWPTQISYLKNKSKNSVKMGTINYRFNGTKIDILVEYLWTNKARQR